ncbi:MAG TPA: hypothetical protein VFW97_09525 [Acidimicrobiia bacterium]|jgi:hypothetical protein|nr:hypothetical protein [Acidimicrobiia bacterium]
MIWTRASRLDQASSPTREACRSGDSNAALEQLFWERRFDDAPLDGIAEIPALADDPITTSDLAADRPVIRWRASPPPTSTADPPPICWHASR